MKFTREQLEKIISEAPEWAEFYYHGENVIPYRIVIDGIIFSFKGGWKIAINHEISRAYLRDSHKLTDLQKQLDEMKMNDSSEEITYENGMRECVKRIALIVGKQFAVNVGYQDLPSVIESAFRDLQGEIVMLEEKLAMNDSQDMQSVDSESVEPKEGDFSDFSEGLFLEYMRESKNTCSQRMLFKKYIARAVDFSKSEVEQLGISEKFKNGDVVWDGKGLPPVGCECLFNANGSSCFNACEIKFIGDKHVVFTDCYSEWSYVIDKVEFKIKLTPEQKQAQIDEKNGKSYYKIICKVENDNDVCGLNNPWGELKDKWQKIYIDIAKQIDFKGKLSS